MHTKDSEKQHRAIGWRWRSSEGHAVGMFATGRCNSISHLIAVSGVSP